ncbi:MAG: 4-(cytidine 5'-diphospho)-2-C-methyl-D-erythritol kinase [bacterium]
MGLKFPRFQLPAPGKLNLCLNITGRRVDGYHELQTAFHILSIGDLIDFEAAENIEVICDQIIQEENLVFKAANTLAEFALNQSNKESKRPFGARITVNKVLPMGAGLGGGSSDAATTLVGLNLMWQLRLDTEMLLTLARPLGADLPVFVKGCSAWAEGIGERLTPINLLPKHYVVIQPNCEISTAEIFSHRDLTRDSAPITIARFLEQGSGNDCEAVARKLYPEVDKAILWLNKWGPAKMTGTGSCVFLDFDSKNEAEAVCREVPEKWHVFIAEGLDESPLLRKVKLLKESFDNVSREV